MNVNPQELLVLYIKNKIFNYRQRQKQNSWGLSVLPAVVSANCNEELMALTLTYSVLIVIQPKPLIAIASALPMNIAKQNIYQETLLLTNRTVPRDVI